MKTSTETLPADPIACGSISISILPPRKPILPVVWPPRWPRRPCPRAWRGPQAASASLSIIVPSVSIPAAGRTAQMTPILFPGLAHRYRRRCSRNRGNSLHCVAFLSWIRHPEPTGSRRATPLLLFQHSPGQSRRWRRSWRRVNQVRCQRGAMNQRGARRQCNKCFPRRAAVNKTE